MKLTLRCIGNSKGVVIPASLLKKLNLSLGDILQATVDDGKLVMTPIVTAQKYCLDNMIAKCDENAPIPTDIADWDRLSLIDVAMGDLDKR